MLIPCIVSYLTITRCHRPNDGFLPYLQWTLVWRICILVMKRFCVKFLLSRNGVIFWKPPACWFWEKSRGQWGLEFRAVTERNNRHMQQMESQSIERCPWRLILNKNWKVFHKNKTEFWKGDETLLLMWRHYETRNHTSQRMWASRKKREILGN